MAAPAGAYKPTKEEIYVAIGAALSDNITSSGTASSGLDAPAIQKSVAENNPNWTPILPRKFKKYQQRVLQARDAGIAPNAIVSSGDDGSVSTIGSMASRAKSFITGRSMKSKAKTGAGATSAGNDDEDTLVSTTNSTIGSMTTSFKKKIGSLRKKNKKVAIPSSIGAGKVLTSPSPLQEPGSRTDEVEYRAIPTIISEEGEEIGTAQTSPASTHSAEEAERKLEEVLNAEVVEVDTRELTSDGKGLYADDNDGKKGRNECCTQGCVIL